MRSANDHWQPDSRHGRDLIILDNLITRRKRFRLIIAKTNDLAYRKRLIAYLNQRYQGISVSLADEGDAETLDFDPPSGRPQKSTFWCIGWDWKIGSVVIPR